MKGIRLAIMSPAFPPSVNGLGDYALRLGNALSDRLEKVIFFGLQSEASIHHHYTIKQDKKDLLKKVKENEITHLFINYSNYGYQKKGVPLWLTEAVKELKLDQKVYVLTFFHELYASGNPWQSVFWLRSFQKQVFRNLYSLSDFTFCSNERVQGIIEQKCGDKGRKNENIGIFSNIIEPQQVNASRNGKIAVVFGTSGRRRAVYEHLLELNQLITNHSIERIMDIGGGKTVDPVLINCELTVCGELTSEEIAELLDHATWGFIDYPASLLAKSGIFAAYAAYGLAVVNFSTDPALPLDGLEYNKHLTQPFKTTVSPHDLGVDLNRWYSDRDISKHTEAIYQKMIATNPANN